MSENCPDCGENLPEQSTLHSCKQTDNEDPAWYQKAIDYVLKQLSEDVDKVRIWVEAKRKSHPELAPPELAALAVKYASRWSGRSGFVTGLGDFLGPIGFASGTTVDIVYAARLSIQMAQRIYFIYGHDISDDAIKLRIMEALGGGSAAVGKAAGQGATRVGTRLTKKYITGALLKAIKAFFRRLGIIFTQKGLIAAMPIVGSGVNMFVNKKLMNNLGKQLLADVVQP